MLIKPGPNELRLIHAIENSQVADFSPSAAGSQKERILDAAVLHDICFGVDMQLEENAPARPVAIPLAGIHILGATIAGVLNLQYLASRNGGPFPKLDFESCQFDRTINLAGCRIRSLSLKNCALRILLCTDAVIDGPIDVSGIHPPLTGEEIRDEASELKFRREKEADKTEKDSPGAADGREKCWAVFAGTHIAGRFNAANAVFVAPAKRGLENYVPQSRHARFALDLRGTHIQGSVNLRPEVSAYGGVCLNLAKVEGSVWCNGAKLRAVEDCAFSADYASIQGSIYMRPLDRVKEKSIRFQARGCIRFFAANIGGSLYLGGAHLWPQSKSDLLVAGDEDFDVLNATNAIIGGSCHLNSWQSEAMLEPKYAYRLVANGDVILRSMRIRGDLVLSGAVVKRVLANNIDIGGRCNFGGTVSPLPKFYLRAFQKIDLSGGKIKGELNMAGGHLGSARNEFVLEASGVEIGGNCRLCAAVEEHLESGKTVAIGIPFVCQGNILMREARIGNSLIMEGASLHGPQGIRLHGAEKNPALDLSGAIISGDAKLMTWSPLNAITSVAFQMTAGDQGLRLSGTKITQKLILNGAVLRASNVAIHAANIEIGGKASLGTHVGSRDGVRTAFFFSSVGRIVLTSALIKLGLDMKGARIEAVKSPKGSQGASNQNNDPREICNTPVLDLTLARVKFVALSECTDLKNGNGKPKPIPFEAVGMVKLDNAEIDTELDLTNGCFRGPVSAAHARIGTSILLEETRLWSGSTDQLLSVKDVSAPRRLFDWILRTPEEASEEERKEQRHKLSYAHIQRDQDEMVPDLSLRGAKVGYALKVKNLMRCGEGEWTAGNDDEMSHTTIDLRGLHVEELQDDGGEGWTQSGRIRFWLDGFRCKRLAEVIRKSDLQPFWIFVYTVIRRTINASWLPKMAESRPLELTRKAELVSTGHSQKPMFSKPGQVSITEPWPSELRNTAEPESSEADPKQIPKTPRWDSFRRPIYDLFERNGPWEERLRWLNRQYFRPGEPQKYEFGPDAFEQIVNSLNSTGSYDDARRIASARITHEKRSTLNWLMRRPWWLFRVLYDYGFSITRALLTFAFCIGVGWYAAHVANYGIKGHPEFGDALIVNTIPPQGLVVKGEQSLDIFAAKPSAGDAYEADLPCGTRVRSILYAMDVFLPVLNLHQQEVCTIAPDRIKWRYAQALYAVLGWILTPITILTLTGTLRRHLEK